MKTIMNQQLRDILAEMVDGDGATFNSMSGVTKAFVDQEAERITKLFDSRTEKVTRLEVIDHTKSFEEGGGRAFVHFEKTTKVELSFQDDDRTLKVFISKR